jgi:hypothetical protein
VARRHSFRASDHDREEVVERLRAATAEGRLLVEELEQRLEVAFKALTYGELDALVDDLPDVAVGLPAAPQYLPARRRRPGLPILAGATLALGLLLTTVAAVAASSLARLNSVAAGASAPTHAPRDGYYHAGPAGLLAGFASLIVIISLVLVCAALGWLFAQDSEGEPSETSP